MKRAYTPTAVLRHTTPPGASLIKCTNCNQWRGSDTYIMLSGKRVKTCKACREKHD